MKALIYFSFFDFMKKIELKNVCYRATILTVMTSALMLERR